MTDHTGTLCIDLGGCPMEADAIYGIDAEWDGPHLISTKATLLSATIDGHPVSRDKIVRALRAVLVDGEGKVQENEDREAGEWCATAERDARDDYADSRSWAAE